MEDIKLIFEILENIRQINKCVLKLNRKRVFSQFTGAVVRETRQESQSNCADKKYFNITVFLTCFAVIVHL